MKPYAAPVVMGLQGQKRPKIDSYRHVNEHLVGQHVIVVKKSVWKDYEGIVKSVHYDGSVLVEIQATMRQERLTLDLLKFRYVEIINVVFTFFITMIQ